MRHYCFIKKRQTTIMDERMIIVLSLVVVAALAFPSPLIQPENGDFIEDQGFISKPSLPGGQGDKDPKVDSLAIPPLEQQVIEANENSEVPQPPKEQTESPKEQLELPKEEQKPPEERTEPPKEAVAEQAEPSKENEASSPPAVVTEPEQRPPNGEKPIVIEEEDRPSFLSNIFPWFSSFSLPHLSSISFPSWSSIKIPKLPFFSLPSSSSLSKSRDFTEEENPIKYMWIKYYVSE